MFTVPSLPSLVRVQSGEVNTTKGNAHGEADYAIWHHCIHAPSTNILLISADTDSWVYGLGLSE